MNDRPSQVRALSCVFMYSKHPQNTQKIEEKNNPKLCDHILKNKGGALLL